MHRWLPEISFYDDLPPHPAAMNMAIDEALLGILRRPVLRAYRWARPAVSFGYFQEWAPVLAAWPGRDAVRRWTGGGVVPHGEDWTYSLLLPRGSAGRGANAAETYAAVHGALCGALRDAGIDAAPAASAGPKVSQACFENPVRHDVLAAGRKIAGAAQRRTRAGLLHQGSIQGLALPADFGLRFAGRLAASVRSHGFDVTGAAEMLAAEKYGTARWLEMR